LHKRIAKEQPPILNLTLEFSGPTNLLTANLPTAKKRIFPLVSKAGLRSILSEP
jgi:hypothetical protein